MATETVRLIPKSERGILLNHVIENVGAGELQFAEYQNVTISRYFVRYLPPNQDEKSATIVRKDGICRPAIAPQILRNLVNDPKATPAQRPNDGRN